MGTVCIGTGDLSAPLALLENSSWDMWHVWVLIAFGIAILEMLTSGFVLGCFVVGCFAAALLDLVGVTAFLPQLWMCAGVTFASFFLIRPFFLRTMRGADSDTGTDSLVGSVAQITHGAEGDSLAQIKVGSEYWRVEGPEGLDLRVGSKVRVTGVAGNRLLVEPAEAPAAPVETP
ncbi:MAG: NfeD family protein [Planctomycetota bacterium]